MANDKEKGSNIGEWSEIYVFFRMMEKGELQSADASMNPISNAYLPVIKVIREEEPGNLFDYYTKSAPDHPLEIYNNGILVKSCTVAEFSKAADLLLGELKSAKKNYGRTTSLNFANTQSQAFFEVEEFLADICIKKIKAPSKAISQHFGGKSDITMEVKQQDGTIIPSGFSVKSSIGSTSTLGNSSGACQFYYELEGCSKSLCNEVNGIRSSSYVIDRVRRIESLGMKPRYIGVSSMVYRQNLHLIGGSEMEKILASALWLAFARSNGKRDSAKPLTKVLPHLCEADPCSAALYGDKDHVEAFYKGWLSEYAFRVACGMNPDSPCDRNIKIRGGYIFVTKQGDVLAYYAADQDMFKDFLFENLKFDSPSSARRDNDSNGFSLGKIIEKDGKFVFTLNLQLRFTS